VFGDLRRVSHFCRLKAALRQVRTASHPRINPHATRESSVPGPSMTASTGEDEDRKDMARLAAGQDGALNDLMGRYGERLFHYLLRMTQNETEAADLAEEAFVRVYLHRSQFQAGRKFSTWLYAIATNLARDWQRRQSRHPQVSLDSSNPGTEHALADTLAETKPNPGEALESSERARAVRLAIAGLPEDLRTPLVLSVYEDKSYAEIGEIVDASVKAVEMRLYRARQELRERLGPLLA
jgi:RNA polymerase sigma-70 factor, ECF subfamily